MFGACDITQCAEPLRRVHIIAIGAVTLMRGGSGQFPTSRPHPYLTRYPDRWRLGWTLWMLAALSLLAFYAWWGDRIGKLWPVAIAAQTRLRLVGRIDFHQVDSAPRHSPLSHRGAASDGAGNGLYLAPSPHAIDAQSALARWRGARGSRDSE
jgi:hypothetical protein